jgi:tRNA-dihydrouridine synthase A
LNARHEIEHLQSVNGKQPGLDRRLSLAPMMQRTDRHFRYLIRLISRHVLLYTEMVTTGALIHGDRPRHLDFHPGEHPLALQLGGSNPRELAECARIATDWGYDEINLNVGCPSDRVQNGRFGACLLAEPERVAGCVAAMRAVTHLPVTVKTRTGIDDRDSYDELCHFIETVHTGGSDIFIIHARKAWLNGLSPKENRSVPPLDYPRVHRIKHDYPALTIVLNGGIETLGEAETHLGQVDGVMIGRAAYHDPYLLAAADHRIFDSNGCVSDRMTILQRYRHYIAEQLADGIRLNNMSRHALGLFAGQPGARAYRRILCEQGNRPDAGIEVIDAAASQIGIREEISAA